MGTHVALLRGINVGGNRRVPMADLRALAGDAGFRDIRSYVASGNLILTSDDPAQLIEATLESLIERRFGFQVDVVVRPAAQWAEYRDGNPFRDEAVRAPNLVMLCIGKQPATGEYAASLRDRAGPNERVEVRGDALWLYFGDGSGRSKMGACPSNGIWTTRNFRTVQNLSAMLG